MYEFKAEDVYRFRDTMGAMARKKGNELEFALCPYCHGGGSRDKNTFFISFLIILYHI